MRTVILVALSLTVSSCGASHSTLFDDDFSAPALGSEWSAWRKTFVETGGTLVGEAMPRDGFDYGHAGHGRGALLVTHVGDATWTDYAYHARVLVQAPDPAFNPQGMLDCDRGIAIAFRVARSAESWNDPASSEYVFGVRAVECGTDGHAGTWTLSRDVDHYFASPTGWGANEQGTSTMLATGTTSAVRDLDWNDVEIDVVGTSIDVTLNGVPVAHFDDLDGHALGSGGVGVLGWWENPVTVDSVSVTDLCEIADTVDMARIVLLSVFALSGCYLSHELGDGGAPRDAAPVDASRDAPRVDAFRPHDLGEPEDTGGPDATTECLFGWDDTVEATIAITADDAYTLYVNGIVVGTDGGGSWHDVDHYTVTLHRHPTRFNVIAVDAQNLWTVDGRDRGVVLDLRAMVGGIERVWTSGTHWRFGGGTVPPAPPPPDGWTTEDFDASGWSRVADEGPHGEIPWGDVLGTSDAHWMWSYESDRPAAAKVGAEHAYMRTTLVFTMNGDPGEERSPCP